MKTKKEVRLPFIMEKLKSIKPKDLPEFVSKVYLGEFDNEIDTTIINSIGEKELRLLSHIAILAYNKHTYNQTMSGEAVKGIKKSIEHLLPYFEISHWGYTRLLAYYYRLKYKHLTKKDYFALAEILQISPPKLYKYALREKDQDMDPITKERALKLLDYMHT